MIAEMARIGLLAMMLVFAACDAAPTTLPVTPMTPAAEKRLADFADPAKWERLDGRRLRDPRLGIVFVRIPAGEFDMGTDTPGVAHPRHRVAITRDYLLAETELTIGQWRRYVDEFAGDPNVPIPDGGDDLPMTLSFRDAQALARALSYRIPTEAEWERACCGGLERDAEPWSDEAGMRKAAWFHRNADYRSHPVRNKEPNAYGLYDMLGNLWEWCIDDYDPVAYAKRKPPARDPRGTTAGQHRVIRGGSWFSVPPATPRTRSSAEVSERNAFFGVRFARSTN